MIGLLIGILRTKCLAILLGPSGVALFGIYSSITDLISTISGMGIQTSGVRKVAESNGQGDALRISQTIVVLRRVTLLLGLLGGLTLLVLRGPISRYTFGDDSHSFALGLLSLSVLFTAISSGQMALIQGMRRMRDLASTKILGAFFGLAVTVPMVWLLGENGIAPAMVAVAGTLMVVSWQFARCIPSEPATLTWIHAYKEYRELLGLGLAFMISGVLASGTAYLIRSYITQHLGLTFAGYYQAAFALSGIYVGIVTSAMAADYFPRLTVAAGDNKACNRIVNEQSDVALLLAGPGIVTTITLAPYVLSILYSAEFLPAVDVLRWQILGDFGRIVSWPMGFIILAKGKGKIFVATELATNMAHLLFVFYATQRWLLPGTGIAFFLMYLFNCFLTRLVAGKISGFSWTSAYLRLLLIYSVAILGAFLVPFVFDSNAALLVGSVFSVLSVLYSSYRLYHLLGPELISRKLATTPLKHFFRPSQSESNSGKE